MRSHWSLATAIAAVVIVSGFSPNLTGSGRNAAETDSAIATSTESDRLPAAVAPGDRQATLARLPLSFEANAGQLNDEVRYVARGDAFDLFLTDREAVFVNVPPIKRADAERAILAGGTPGVGAAPSIIRMQFVGSRRKLDVQAFDVQPGVVNHLIGNDPSAWVTGAATFGQVRYADVWDGIDVVFHGRRGGLEYDFEVAPGVDHRLIELAFADADDLALDADGNLVVVKNGVRQTHRAPTVIEDPDGLRSKRLAGRFVLHGKDRVGFELENRDDSLPLLVDPEVVYATPFFGGSDIDNVFSLDVGDDGRVTIAGYTQSLDFPGTHASSYQPLNVSGEPGHASGVISRLSGDGTRIEWTTYLAGSNADYTPLWKVRVDSRGFVYVCGATSASDFPTTPNAFDRIFGDFEGFVAVLTPNGANLVYSTFVGGSDYDFMFDLALLADSRSSDGGRGRMLMAVTGATSSPDFPLFNAASVPYDRTVDGIVSVIDPTGGGLVYSSRIPGGAGSEYGLAIDVRGDALAVTGHTNSTPRPKFLAWHHAFEAERGVAQMIASNPFWAASPGYANAWNQVLTKPFILPAGQVAATFVARWETEAGFDFLRFRISLDGGTTWITLAELDGFSAGFELRSVDLSAYAGRLALLQFQFLSDELVSDQDGGIDTNGSAIDSIAVTGFAPDDFDIGLNGWVPDDVFLPLPADFQYGPLGGATDAFVALVKPFEPSIRVAVIGGRGSDGSIAGTVGEVRFAPDGTIVAVGQTSSATFPATSGAYQPTRLGTNLWVARFASDLSQLLAATYLGGNNFEFPNGLAVDHAGRVIITGISGSSNYPNVDPIDLRPLLGPGGGGFDRDYIFSILSADLSELVHSTKFGDVGWELGGEVDLGPDGSIYLLGRKRMGAEEAGQSQDVFVVKLRP